MVSQKAPTASHTSGSSTPKPPNGGSAPIPPPTPPSPAVERTTRPPSRATAGRQSPAVSDISSTSRTTQKSATALAKAPVRLYRDVPSRGSRPLREAPKKPSPQPPATSGENLSSAASTSVIDPKVFKKAEKKARREAKKAQKLQGQQGENVQDRHDEGQSSATTTNVQPRANPAVALSPEVPLLADQSQSLPNGNAAKLIPPRAPGSPSPASRRNSKVFSPPKELPRNPAPSVTTPVQSESPVRSNTKPPSTPVVKAASSDDDPALKLEAGCQIPGVICYVLYEVYWY